MSDLTHRGPPLREASAVGRIVTADRQDGEKTRLTKNSARYEHVLAHNLRVLSRLFFHSKKSQERLDAPREAEDLCALFKREQEARRGKKAKGGETPCAIARFQISPQMASSERREDQSVNHGHITRNKEGEQGKRASRVRGLPRFN